MNSSPAAQPVSPTRRRGTVLSAAGVVLALLAGGAGVVAGVVGVVPEVPTASAPPPLADPEPAVDTVDVEDRDGNGWDDADGDDADGDDGDRGNADSDDADSDGWVSGDPGEQEADDQAALDALIADCEGGDMQACDDLYWITDYGSPEEAIAVDCGGHYPDGGPGCVDRPGQAQDLAELVDACQGGDMEACDDLYWESPLDSPEEAIAEDCGGHFPGAGGGGSCVWTEESTP